VPSSIKAAYTLVKGRLRRDVVVHVDNLGRISGIEGGPWDGSGEGSPRPAALGVSGAFAQAERRVQLLPDRVLVPGFVNAHSHSFQRVLRGRTEYRPLGVSADDLWSWRTAMLRAASSLDPAAIEAVAAFAFTEMVLAGFTHVAEFHSLHHQADGTQYADPLELTRRVLAGAERAGIGATLLRVAYQRGGAEVPLTQEQRRFVDASPEAYARALEDTEALARPDDARPVRVGIAAHSVRTLDRTWLAALAELGEGRLVHAHVAGHPREVEQCVAEHGIRPVRLLAELGLLSERFTAVHATHLDPTEVRLLGEAEVTACVCPTTERNMGGGLPLLQELRAAGASLAVGTDSHVRIDPFAELRALEDGERRRLGRRNVLLAGDGMGGGVAPTLFAVGSSGRAVGAEAGEIAVGHRADLVALSIDEAAVAGVAEGADGADALLAALVLGGTSRLVRDVWIGGRRVVQDGEHLRWGAVLSRYREVVAALWR
jgi:formimidoylglutamate deiminase